MGSTISVALLLTAELFVFAIILQLYRRVELRYLKYGAAALLVGVLNQFILLATVTIPGFSIVLLFAASGVLEMVYAILLSCAIISLTSRKVNIYWVMGTMIIYSVVAVVSVSLLPLETEVWLVSRVPVSIVMGLSIVLLIRGASGWTSGSLGIGSVLTMQMVAGLAGPMIFNGNAIFEFVMLTNTVLVLLAAICWLVLQYESSYQEMLSQQNRLEQSESENKRLEYHFAQAQKLESLGALAGGIAHDFNNMLTAILGYASLAVKKLPSDSEVRQDIYMIMSGARQAVELTGQMLTYAGKGSVEFKALDLNQVVQEMDALVTSIVPASTQLDKKLTSDLPRLKGDRVKLGQAVMQLVANAVDAVSGPEGQIEVSTGLMEVDQSLLNQSYFGQQLEPGAYVFLKVEDNGVGMDADQASRMFDPFYSEKNSSKGLGLSTLSGIVRQHQGCVLVRSEINKGAEFVLLFPAVVYEERSSLQVDHSSANTKSINVLLADDDPRIRNLMSTILEAENITLTVVDDGREALQSFEQHANDYDLLLIDCTMPKMSGPELYRHVRSLGSTVPVILISGYHQEQVIRNISNDPRAYFVKKPFSVDDILAEIDRAMQRSSPESAAS